MLTNPRDIVLHRGLIRLRSAYDGLLAVNAPPLTELTSAEVHHEAHWRRVMEPALTNLYWHPLQHGLSAAPENERELRQWLRDSLGTAAAVAILLALLKRFQLSAVNIGGQMALNMLGLSGDFSLTNADYLDELDAQAEELTSLDTDLSLIDTTVDQLAAGIPEARQRDGNTLLELGTMIAAWSAYRSDSIATTEQAREVANGLNWAYKENGVATMMFTTREGACPICSPHNGTIVPVDDPGDIDPPIHPHCRCIWTAITDGWQQPDDVWEGE